jgi:hypothetical protein
VEAVALKLGVIFSGGVCRGGLWAWASGVAACGAMVCGSLARPFFLPLIRSQLKRDHFRRVRHLPRTNVAHRLAERVVNGRGGVGVIHDRGDMQGNTFGA